MVRGETPIELGDGWFSAKIIEVVRPQFKDNQVLDRRSPRPQDLHYPVRMAWNAVKPDPKKPGD